jgi:hypothetical protein
MTARAARRVAAPHASVDVSPFAILFSGLATSTLGAGPDVL